jgi:hypothetical protein
LPYVVATLCQTEVFWTQGMGGNRIQRMRIAKDEDRGITPVKTGKKLLPIETLFVCKNIIVNG